MDALTGLLFKKFVGFVDISSRTDDSRRVPCPGHLTEPFLEMQPFGRGLCAAEDTHGPQSERAGLDLATAGVDNDLGTTASDIDVEIGFLGIERLLQSSGCEDRISFRFAVDDLDRNTTAVANEFGNLPAIRGLSHGTCSASTIVVRAECPE